MSDLKKIEIPYGILQDLTYDVPFELRKDLSGKPYYGNETIIAQLNILFGPFGWSFKIISSEILTCTARSNDVNAPSSYFASVLGRLEVYLERPDGSIFTVSKEQFGSKAVTGGQANQKSDYKSAASDALKKCAMLFGVGMNLKMTDQERNYYHIKMLKPNQNNNSVMYANEINAWITGNGISEDVLNQTIEIFQTESNLKDLNVNIIYSDANLLEQFYKFLKKASYM